MARKENILNELNELKSSLLTAGEGPIYAVPAGYFEGLAELILKRIKALEAVNATEELGYLSPSLNSISRQMPYAVPAGYFEGLAEIQMQGVRENHVSQTSQEELESISPLLSGLKKTIPYTVPQGYFENLTEKRRSKPAARIVSITHRSWFRYAAAAVVTGIVVLSGLIILNTRKAVDPVDQPYAWVKKNIREVDKAVIEDFVKLADEEFIVRDEVVTAPVKSEEIKDLMKDVSDKELQDFLDETAPAEDNEVIMMN